jgi:hypothetical protein
VLAAYPATDVLIDSSVNYFCEDSAAQADAPPQVADRGALPVVEPLLLPGLNAYDDVSIEVQLLSATIWGAAGALFVDAEGQPVGAACSGRLYPGMAWRFTNDDLPPGAVTARIYGFDILIVDRDCSQLYDVHSKEDIIAFESAHHNNTATTALVTRADGNSSTLYRTPELSDGQTIDVPLVVTGDGSDTVIHVANRSAEGTFITLYLNAPGSGFIAKSFVGGFGTRSISVAGLAGDDFNGSAVVEGAAIAVVAELRTAERVDAYAGVARAGLDHRRSVSTPVLLDADSTYTVSVAGESGSEVVATVVDAAGQTAYQQAFELEAGTGRLTIPAGAFALQEAPGAIQLEAEERIAAVVQVEGPGGSYLLAFDSGLNEAGDETRDPAKVVPYWANGHNATGSKTSLLLHNANLEPGETTFALRVLDGGSPLGFRCVTLQAGESAALPFDWEDYGQGFSGSLVIVPTESTQEGQRRFTANVLIEEAPVAQTHEVEPVGNPPDVAAAWSAQPGAGVSLGEYLFAGGGPGSIGFPVVNEAAGEPAVAELRLQLTGATASGLPQRGVGAVYLNGQGEVIGTSEPAFPPVNATHTVYPPPEAVSALGIVFRPSEEEAFRTVSSDTLGSFLSAPRGGGLYVHGQLVRTGTNSGASFGYSGIDAASNYDHQLGYGQAVPVSGKSLVYLQNLGVRPVSVMVSLRRPGEVPPAPALTWVAFEGGDLTARIERLEPRQRVALNMAALFGEFEQGLLVLRAQGPLAVVADTEGYPATLTGSPLTRACVVDGNDDCDGTLPGASLTAAFVPSPADGFTGRLHLLNRADSANIGPIDVTVEFFDSAGALHTADTLQVPAHESASIDVPGSLALPSGSAGYLRVSSSSNQVMLDGWLQVSGPGACGPETFAYQLRRNTAFFLGFLGAVQGSGREGELALMKGGVEIEDDDQLEFFGPDGLELTSPLPLEQGQSARVPLTAITALAQPFAGTIVAGANDAAGVWLERRCTSGEPVELFEGWNLIVWPGPALGSADALIAHLNGAVAPPVWESIARYDAVEGAWLQTFRMAPLPSFNTLNSVVPGQTAWLFVTDSAVLAPVPDLQE